MSKRGLVIVLILMASKNYAQGYTASTDHPQDYFALIQTDNNQAFYARLDSQFYASSPAGHLILSQLKDSSYTITIGFPGQAFPEQRFIYSVHQKDQALRLKLADGTAWRLYDGQGGELKMAPEEHQNDKPLFTSAKKDDAFSRLMAAVVQDTAVMYNTYAIITPSPSPATAPPVVQDTASSMVQGTLPATRDSSAVSLVSPPVPPLDTLHLSAIVRDTSPSLTAMRDTLPLLTTTTLLSTAPAPTPPTVVVKLSERKSPQALRLVYADHPANKETDTIVVIIPMDSPTLRPIHPSDTTHSLFPGGHGPNPDSPTLSSGTVSHPKSTLPFVNSDCHSYATDYDLDRLRVRMLEAGKDDDRIQTAHKIFKTKCFSTQQIKALCEVFTTDTSRFKFLETAYPFVSDDHFPELVTLLTDPVYSGKFRTMTDRH